MGDKLVDAATKGLSDALQIAHGARCVGAVANQHNADVGQQFGGLLQRG